MGEFDDEESVLHTPRILGEEQEYVGKLRAANHALRTQLKEFSKALDAALSVRANNNNNSTHDVDGKKSLRAIVNSKEKQLNGLKKKLETYKKQNEQLKKQLRSAYTSDKVVQMGNENKEKEQIIQKLIAENKSLTTIQRNQAKQIQKQESGKEEWPARVAALQDELRVTRERLRTIKEKSKQAEEHHKKQHEQVMRLMGKNKELSKEIARYEAANGKAKTRSTLNREQIEKEWNEQREKLTHKISVLEKSNKQERNKLAIANRKGEEKIEELSKKIKQMQEKIDESEKDMRIQVLQVKKLKRNLRELATGEAPLPLGTKPWAVNLAQYLNGENNDQPSEETPDTNPEIEETTQEQEQEEKEEEEEEEENDEDKEPPIDINVTPTPPPDTSSPKARSPLVERSHTPTDEIEGKKEEENRDEAATKVQALFRGRKDRLQVEEMKNKKKELELEKQNSQQQMSAFAKPMGMKKRKKKPF